MQDRFTAEKITFENIPGFMVRQYHNGEKVCEQFISANEFQDYIQEAGIEGQIEILN